MSSIYLKYGMNPHQKNAKLYCEEKLPIKILNGEASYINFLDALNAIQLVSELNEATGLPSAASFKHVSPTGAAVYSPLSESQCRSYFVEDTELSPLAIAYARARGADRMSSFGDCAAFSEKVDVTVAKLLKREVSDSIIAPGYDDDALEILKQKKKGKYLIIEIDADYVPTFKETRTVNGITLEQDRNDLKMGQDSLENCVTELTEIPKNARRDLLIALITLKYTQSNSVCFALDGQTIGIGAGQQSRIHCTRLAADKADNWWLRQHPIIKEFDYHTGITRTEMNNAIDGWINNQMTHIENENWENNFKVIPNRLTETQKQEWIGRLEDVSYASDAYLPFRDNIDRAARSGVKYIAQSGFSANDDQIIQAANEYKMIMAFTSTRLFHH
ncbi:phosphoribosylaminoimidazolecarboxamide formyltransferase [Chengkuizengella axinellae]|uniref:Phosphoribosylaminoimidazolecarboxamide formyltransferase n=1 Tax=Chengkuizengella axinellae TaxID=3064388 RepID=A0ABT9IUC0_9BACL|nr:phosphoribosylaminoimidazolecarboxamide formyltransferase [Chengkuizengella sp. 2205SS18-9]MDP5272944.1 phosphoribosylaminoimidazolecarboxamide formyltransferase [Chengkuizengella sp. 2205SS18-9]